MTVLGSMTLFLTMWLLGPSCALEDSCTAPGLGTGPMDHWPTVENAEVCKLQHCSKEMVSELN